MNKSNCLMLFVYKTIVKRDFIEKFIVWIWVCVQMWYEKRNKWSRTRLHLDFYNLLVLVAPTFLNNRFIHRNLYWLSRQEILAIMTMLLAATTTISSNTKDTCNYWAEISYATIWYRWELEGFWPKILIYQL